MTFTSGDSATPMATLLNQAVTEGKTYTDTQLTVINWTTFTPTTAVNWTGGGCRYRKFGPIVELRVLAAYSGTTITASSKGKIADTVVFTGAGFPAGILPSDDQYFRGYNATAGVVGGYFATSGQIRIADMYPTASLVSSSVVSIKAIYMVG